MRRLAPARLPLLGGGQPGGFAHTDCRYSGHPGGTTTPAAPQSVDAGRHATDPGRGGTPPAALGIEAASGPGRYGCSAVQSSRHRCGRHSHSAHRVSHEGDKPCSGAVPLAFSDRPLVAQGIVGVVKALYSDYSPLV